MEINEILSQVDIIKNKVLSILNDLKTEIESAPEDDEAKGKLYHIKTRMRQYPIILDDLKDSINEVFSEYSKYPGVTADLLNQYLFQIDAFLKEIQNELNTTIFIEELDGLFSISRLKGIVGKIIEVSPQKTDTSSFAQALEQEDIKKLIEELRLDILSYKQDAHVLTNTLEKEANELIDEYNSLPEVPVTAEDHIKRQIILRKIADFSEKIGNLRKVYISEDIVNLYNEVKQLFDKIDDPKIIVEGETEPLSEVIKELYASAQEQIEQLDLGERSQRLRKDIKQLMSRLENIKKELEKILAQPSSKKEKETKTEKESGQEKESMPTEEINKKEKTEAEEGTKTEQIEEQNTEGTKKTKKSNIKKSSIIGLLRNAFVNLFPHFDLTGGVWDVKGNKIIRNEEKLKNLPKDRGFVYWVLNGRMLKVKLLSSNKWTSLIRTDDGVTHEVPNFELITDITLVNKH